MAGTVRYGPQEYPTQFLDNFDGHVSSKWAWQFVTITLVPSVRNMVPAVKVPFFRPTVVQIRIQCVDMV